MNLIFKYTSFTSFLNSDTSQNVYKNELKFYDGNKFHENKSTQNKNPLNELEIVIKEAMKEQFKENCKFFRELPVKKNNAVQKYRL